MTKRERLMCPADSWVDLALVEAAPFVYQTGTYISPVTYCKSAQ